MIKDEIIQPLHVEALKSRVQILFGLLKLMKRRESNHTPVIWCTSCAWRTPDLGSPLLINPRGSENWDPF